MAISKKEKGTENSTQDSVKNQNKYKDKNLIKVTVVSLLENLEIELTKKFNFLTDNHSIQENKRIINTIRHIRTIALKDPRLPYKILQNKIYDTYEADKTITGVKVYMNFDEIKNINTFNPEVYGFKKS